MRRLPMVVAALLAMAACDDPVRTVSESSLRNATARAAADELRGLGYAVRPGLRCRTLHADVLPVIRVRCLGRTIHDTPVRVDTVAYRANSPHPDQDYVITVGGREVVHRPCLGPGCEERT